MGRVTMKDQDVLDIVNEIGAYYQNGYNQLQRESFLREFRAYPQSALRNAWHRHLQESKVERRPTMGQLLEYVREERDSTKDFDTPGDVAEVVLSPEEQAENAAAAAFLNEVLLWHSLGLVEKQESKVSTADFDMDKWRTGGKPRLWSPILDHAYAGLAEVWHSTHTVKAEFYTRYTEQLRRSRASRNAPVQMVENEEMQPVGHVMAGV